MSETPIYDEVMRALRDSRSEKYLLGQMDALRFVREMLNGYTRPSKQVTETIEKIDAQLKTVHREPAVASQPSED